MSRIAITIVAALCVVAGVTGCRSSGGGEPAGVSGSYDHGHGVSVNDHFNGTYRLAAMNGQAPSVDLGLEVDGSRIAGHAHINRFFGAVEGNRVGRLSVTRMAGMPDLMDAEDRYLDILQGGSLSIDPATRDLLVTQGKETLRYARR